MTERSAGRRLAEGHPSRTAFGAAMHRARHQVLDDPRVFVDPLAIRIVGSDAAAEIRPDRADAARPFRRALRALIVARARFAEDALLDAIGRGIRQVVVLGAGLDTLAYRGLLPSEVRVIEVDHPATQAWKRRALLDAGIPEPPTVRYVAADLEVEALDAILGAAPLDPAGRIFVSWLGVTPYLSRPAIAATLRAVAAWPAGSEIVFDYGAIADDRSRAAVSDDQLRAVTALMERMAALGEPWITFFEPSELRADLDGAGFTLIEDLDGPAIDRRYFADRRDALHVARSSHLVHARRDRD